MKYALSILAFLVLSISAHAGNKCVQMFGPSSQQIKIEAQILKNMEKYHYVFGRGKTLFKIMPGGQRLAIGKVKVIQPEYLFEWADKGMHDYMKRNGKYTKADMDQALSETAQATGRGFYVSLRPSDSSMYGTHRTIFKVNEPLFIIDDVNVDIYDNELIYRELRQIGFSGNQGTFHTWLNIFNEQALSEIIPASDADIGESNKNYQPVHNLRPSHRLINSL